MDRESENKAIIEAAKKYGDANVIDLEDDVRVIAVPHGREIKSIKPFLDEYLTKPERRKGTAHVTTLASFIDHANRFKSEHSALFCDDDEDQPSLTSVIDYHEKENDGSPDFGEHRGAYAFPLSDEWKTWSEERSNMDQQTFAEFLEDHIADVIDPSTAGEGTKAFAEKLGIALAGPQRLMELSRGLSITVGQNVGSMVNLQSGEATIQFEETHSSDGKKVNLPGGFTVGIPVFKHGDLFQMPIRLRYRARGGGINWGFVPYRTDLVFRTAITDAAEKAQAETELPLFYGKPE